MDATSAYMTCRTMKAGLGATPSKYSRKKSLLSRSVLLTAERSAYSARSTLRVFVFSVASSVALRCSTYGEYFLE
eukprot:SAG11_NODE_171_length_13596_cov_15.767356_9_plen_75_part_00